MADVQHRAAKQALPDLEFVLSDGSQDRHGTVIDPAGWDLSHFRNNNIAFFNHNKDFPIGTWDRVRAEGGKLVGKLKLAEEGTSARIDEIIKLVRQGILKAVSVGFRPLAAPDIIDGVPHFRKQQLLEASIVGVGSNPNALMMARSIGTSDETLNIVFGEQADTTRYSTPRSSHGEQARTPPVRKNTPMNIPLSKRIEDAQNEILRDKDLLTVEVGKDEPDQTLVGELTSRIESREASLTGLRKAEAVLATSAAPVENRGSVPVVNPRPFALPAKKDRPGEHYLRTLVGTVVAKARGEYNPAGIQRAIAERYGDDGKLPESTLTVMRVATRPEGYSPFDVITRAASAPADTVTSGWASQLVETDVAGFMELLMPASVYPSLSNRGLRLNFGRAGVISIPTRSATPTIAGSFVGQGAPIPVRQGAFSSQTLTPKKMAVISTFTREIAEHSTPAIEGLIRNAIQEDTSVAMDSVLLDATAASTIRPAGLRNGVTVTTATAGGGFAALVGDVKALLGALITASNGNIRNPVWIMNPVNALAISLTQNAGGDFPFKQEINGGQLQGFPVIQSSTVTAGMIVLVDAADFVSTEGDAPRFDMSDQATLHMEDTTPLAIGTAGAPNTVAAPVRSLFQTDSMALRMIMDVNWAMRRSGVIAWTQSVTW